MTKNLPLITIVTISYNMADELDKTMKSVINQTYDNIEYIIIDGGSSDQTVEILKKDEILAKKKGVLLKWISEPDQGIYDAMNKGIELATGVWVNFMNAGDIFYNQNVLASLFSKREMQFVDIIYGDTAYKYDGVNTTLIKALPLSGLKRKMVFCHQSSFVKRQLMETYRYDLNYKLAADYNFFYKARINKKVFNYLPVTISIFDAGTGVSSTQDINSLKERISIIMSEKISFLHKLSILFYFFMMINRLKIKKIIPISLLRRIQMRNRYK